MKLPRLLILTAAALAFAGAAGARDYPRDRDDNPPGLRGGPGTNWENPPGWRGGPGTSPDYRDFLYGTKRYRFTLRDDGFYFNDRYGYYHPRYGLWNQSRHCWNDMDDNPPGPRGGPGTNWENPPGPRGGPGASPDRFGSCR